MARLKEGNMWIIDKDFAPEPGAKPGTNLNATGKKSFNCDESRCTKPFRLYDDNGNLYYEGRSSNSSSFAPLDDFGMPNAGCTEIRYLENGSWQTL